MGLLASSSRYVIKIMIRNPSGASPPLIDTFNGTSGVPRLSHATVALVSENGRRVVGTRKDLKKHLV